MPLTLSPEPGFYPSDTIIAISGDASIASVIVTTDGKDPVLVKTIASSPKYGPEYPYVQTIEDGRGRAVFDGAFSKFYNSRWMAADNASGNPTSFAELSSSFKFLYNAFNFIRRGGTGNKLLFLGDKFPGAPNSGNDNYNVKIPYAAVAPGSSSFYTSVTSLGALMGLDVTVKDSSDYPGNQISISYAECMEYDLIMFMSSYPTASVTQAAAANIAQARRDGVGLYFCTDNGGGPSGDPNARYPEAFYTNANIVLPAITNANFQANMDFSPGTTVAYNKALWGDSELFANIPDTGIIGASTSDSFVNQPNSSNTTLPTEVTVTSGYTTLKFAVIHTDGSITFEQYGYNVGQPPIIELTDESGTTISEFVQTNLRQRRVNFTYLPGPFGNCSGFVLVGDVVVGEFDNAPSGPLSVTWLDTAYTSALSGNLITMSGVDELDVRVRLSLPVVFEYAWDFNRLLLSHEPGIDVAKFIQSINKNEFYSGANPTLPLLKAQQLLYNPTVSPADNLHSLLRNIYTAMT